jgi:hypothetical protein
MHLITYISDYTGTKETIERDLSAITSVAKSENAKRDISGVLFFYEGKFLQIIEGNQFLLQQLMENIKADKRHENVEILINTTVEHRGFESWNMDYFNFSNDKKFSRENLRKLSQNFEKNLVPQSDTLVFLYKKILEEIGN